MAVLEPPSVGDVQQRFDALLERAKQIKPSGDIEPPLPVSSFSGSLGLPQNETSTKAHATAVEIVARRVFQNQAVWDFANHLNYVCSLPAGHHRLSRQ